MAKSEFYSLKNILSYNADYNMIYGERSNGKTTAVLEYGIDDYINSGYVNQMAIVRRWEEDFKGKNGQQMFQGIVGMGWIEKKTKGRFNSVYYYSQRWYFCNRDEAGNKIEQAETPFAMGFSIGSEEHYKSTSYPLIKTILFDEFITRQYYLPEEFVKFQNLLSTIIRLRNDVKIFMCGNTINKYCPYFAEMGLTGIKNQQKGSIDLYTYGDSGLKVAVEFSDFKAKKKASNKYFAFDNPKLQMITNGGWEIDIYPHLPVKYKPKDVVYIFYVLFDESKLQGNIISSGDDMFIYFHRKTTDIPENTNRLVYQKTPDMRRNYRTKMLNNFTTVDKYITKMFNMKKIFYQDNEVGEIINNYIKSSE